MSVQSPCHRKAFCLAALLAGLSISALAQSGTYIDATHYVVPTPDSFPGGITAGPDGALWFTEVYGNKIGRITTAGVITQYPIEPGGLPYGITNGPDGALWFADQGGAVGRITTAGVVTEYSVPSGGTPVGITAGPDGAL